MQTGIRLRAYPTNLQKQVLGQWIGSARFIWNAKCDEHAYHRAYARKFMPLGTYPPVDQTYSQFKDAELTPWLSQVPAQILRNSAVSWYQTYQRFFKKLCRRPVRKKRTDRGSIHLTRELFRFEVDERGTTRIFIGTKTNNVGRLEINCHAPFVEPNSVRVVRDAGKWYVSFSYEVDEATPEAEIEVFSGPEKQLEWLRSQGKDWLETNTVGHDRGVAVPVHSGDAVFDFTGIMYLKHISYDLNISRRLPFKRRGSKTNNEGPSFERRHAPTVVKRLPTTLSVSTNVHGSSWNGSGRAISRELAS